MDPTFSYLSDNAKGAKIRNETIVPCKETIDGLHYPSFATKSGISHAVGVLSTVAPAKHAELFTGKVWGSAKPIMRYPKDTLIVDCSTVVDKIAPMPYQYFNSVNIDAKNKQLLSS